MSNINLTMSPIINISMDITMFNLYHHDLAGDGQDRFLVPREVPLNTFRIISLIEARAPFVFACLTINNDDLLLLVCIHEVD